MSCTAADRIVAVLLSLSLYSAGAASAAQPSAEAATVARLYKDYAWQAFASQTALFGQDLAHQDRPTLEKYFAPELASLLLQDAACQVKYQGVCNLDFDLLFNSQDPAVIDLDVQRVARGNVSVKFKNPASEAKTTIDFKLARVAGQWKIADIIYKTKANASLKQLLSRKIP